MSFPLPLGPEKDGVWELATFSFPDHWHLAPSFTRRVSLAVSFPTLRWFAWTLAIHFGPAAEPASNVSTADVRVRLLSPEFTHLPVRFARTRFRCVWERVHLRHFRKVGTGLLFAGHGRWPRATGLVSYPSSCVFLLSWTTPFSVPPAVRILLVTAVIAGLPAPSYRFTQSAVVHSLFHVSGCDTGTIWRLFCSFKTAG